jgi:hypothetical protein
MIAVIIFMPILYDGRDAKFAPSGKKRVAQEEIEDVLHERIVVRGKVLGFLARGDAHDLDGVADHVGGALLAFGSARHLLVAFL